MLDHDGDTHLYLQVTEILRRRIGDLSPGSPVPSEAAIQHEFGVARTTARRALRLLRDEGLVYTVHGQGTFVGDSGTKATAAGSIPFYRQIAQEIAERIRQGDLAPRRSVPSETSLVQHYGVARETVRRAMAVLREEGWVYTVPHRGTYVTAPDAWPQN
ncbi:GntR family transcriptional regulator [Microbispora sp. KK1-11]|uniref:GntR family transcriptional regulator n=1 Tax=Microbispora sp. KK1-11 TaxID=2053005 RepID=UPI0021B01396|nr:GntR family transcriptional regulator [Microbispora sp. KK1-11]